MPRYFFHVRDGYLARDDDGTQLPDIYAAQHEAVRLSEIAGEPISSPGRGTVLTVSALR